MDDTNLDYFEKGLYEPIEGISSPEDARKIITDPRNHKSFCPTCKDLTVWLPISSNEFRSGVIQYYLDRKPCHTFGGLINFGKAFKCSICGQELVFYFKYDNGNIFKVGSYPSYKDIARGKLIKEIAIPSSRIPPELSTALGLKAQGVIIGAYAYLRRVYETLIDDAASEALANSAFTEEKYKKAHVNERITMLSDYLPKCMQENVIAYGILRTYP